MMGRERLILRNLIKERAIASLGGVQETPSGPKAMRV
jgi:hypothetical protein